MFGGGGDDFAAGDVHQRDVHVDVRDVEEYEINKVVVLDLVDDKDKVPILGQYMSNRVVEALTRNKTFRVAQRGEVEETLNQLDLKHSFKYTSDDIQRLGKAMNAQALVMGKLLDIGANIDVHIALVDIASGEVITVVCGFVQVDG